MQTIQSLLVLLVFTGQSLAQNLLVNPGFEAGDFRGWTVSGSATPGVARDGAPILGSVLSDNEVNVHSGEFAGWAKLQYGSLIDRPEVDLILSQTVSLRPNATYRIGYWFSLGTEPKPMGFGGHIRINGKVPQYLWDGVETIVHPEVPHPFAGRTPQHHTHLETFFEADSTTTEVTVDFVLNGNAGLYGFSFDDFSVAIIPEPSVCALLIFGGFLCLCRIVLRG
ncbi:MAG: hypothetical protein L0Z50_12610 [Verrucomicrobiales bacterium]|nr:hypothetical protein [Verrucomicrobiales bacterium]